MWDFNMAAGNQWKHLGRVVQSPIKLTQEISENFDLSFATLRKGFLFILFGLLFLI